MKTFTINLGRGLDVDVLKLVETRVAICTNSGGGKSHLMRLMAERIGGRIPIHIIDWEGEWYTLRPKIDAVLIANKGDQAPQVHTAAKLAQRLNEKRVSAILDVSSLTRLHRLLFVASYIEALMDAPAKHRHPMLVFIDEAHRLCPEVASKGGGKELLAAIQRTRSAVISLMDSGRKRAIGGVLATQRLSKVSKDAIGEANNIFIGRYAQDTDLKRVAELLGLERDQRDAPKTFKPGEFFVQGPALLQKGKPLSGTTQFRSSNTVTKAPRFGVATKPAAPSKSVTKILADLATIPAQVEQEAKDFKAALALLTKSKAEVMRLTRENKLARDGKMSKAEKERIITEAIAQIQPKLEAQANEFVGEERSWWRSQLRMLFERQDKVWTISPLDISPGATDLRAAVHVQIEIMQEHADQLEPSAFAMAAVRGRSPAVATRSGAPKSTSFHRDPSTKAPRVVISDRKAPAVQVDTKGKSRWGHENALPFSWNAVPGKVLTVVVQYYPEVLTLVRVAALAGVPRKSTFRNALSTLRTAELVSSPEGPQSLQATKEAHRVHAPFLPELPHGDALIEQWKSQLGGGVTRWIFDALLTLGGSGTKDAVLAKADVGDSSTSRNAFSKLRSLGLIDKGYPLTLSPHVQEAMP